MMPTEKSPSRPDLTLLLLPPVIFTAVGVAVSVLRGNWNYLALFFVIGLTGAALSQAHRILGERLRILRLALHWGLALFFFLYLMLRVNINFQPSQVVFDALTGIVTGALIQLAVARLILPFFFGNAFCSTACWNGAVFELLPIRGRWSLPAWTRHVPYVMITATVAAAFFLHSAGINPSADETLRRNWILGENVLILLTGIAFTPLFGGRFYCRVLCPFKAVSRLLTPFSAGKIGLKPEAKCMECGECAAACPFEIPVTNYVSAGKRVLSGECVLCETCVAACPESCLQVTIEVRRPPG